VVAWVRAMASDRRSRRSAALATVVVIALWFGRAAAGGGTGASSPGAASTAAGNVWVIEPTAEEAGAVAAGTADIARAQQLARSKQYVEAVQVLESLDRAHPAAVHDCNLALAYLRAGVLTRAQLLWDVSALRGSERPRWCTGDLAKQLSTAMRAAGYAALELQVSPATATVEIAGITVRGMRTVWLAPGPYTVIARAPGLVEESRQVTLAPPGAPVAITLAPPGRAADAPPTTGTAPDGGVVAPVGPGPVGSGEPGGGPVDLDAIDQMAAVDAGVAAPGGPVRWPAWVAIGGGAVAIGVGAVFHVRALGARDDGDRAYQGSPALTDAQDRFATARTEALVSYGVGVAALGVGAWWWLSHRSSPRSGAVEGRAARAATVPAIGAELGAGGAAVTLTWAMGGP
jgi:hypothetical protein